eukprot:181196_1
MSELLPRKKVNNVHTNRHPIKTTQYWTSAIPPTVTSPADDDSIYNNPVMSHADAIDPIHAATPPADEIDPIHALTPHAHEINPIYNDPVMSPARILQFLRNTMFIVKNEIPTTIDAPSDGFKCDQCDHVFVGKVNLKIHKKIHTDCAAVCQFCNKKFARKSNLKQHVRIHTDERPYRCTYCPRTFRQRQSLTAHLCTHTGEKPHQCSHCKKRFSAKCNLTVHLRTHTGDTPYQCAPCNKKYRSKSGYTSHMRKYH